MSGANWESIYDTPNDRMERTGVPTGGWIYRNWVVTGAQAQNPQHWQWTVAITYVPPAATPPATEA